MAKEMDTGAQIGWLMQGLMEGTLGVSQDPPFKVLTTEPRELLWGLELIPSVAQYRKGADGAVVEFIVMVADFQHREHWLHWVLEGEEEQLKPPATYITPKKVVAMAYGNP